MTYNKYWWLVYFTENKCAKLCAEYSTRIIGGTNNENWGERHFI